MANTFITIAEVDKTRPKRVGVKLSDGSWMGCFDNKLWPRLEAGANLNVTVEESERDGRTYRNITGILGTAASPNGSVPTPATDKERLIVREVALKAAVELVSRRSDLEPDFAHVAQWAERFVEWLEQKPDEAPF